MNLEFWTVPESNLHSYIVYTVIVLLAWLVQQLTVLRGMLDYKVAVPLKDVWKFVIIMSGEQCVGATIGLILLLLLLAGNWDYQAQVIYSKTSDKGHSERGPTSNLKVLLYTVEPPIKDPSRKGQPSYKAHSSGPLSQSSSTSRKGQPLNRGQSG